LPLAACIALAACGGVSGGSGQNAAQPLETLAYPVTNCHVGDPVRQALWVIEPGREPRAIADLPATPSGLIPGACELYGASLTAKASRIFSFLQRLGVSPDGRAIVYEITDDFAEIKQVTGDSFVHLLDWRGVLPPEQEGIFAMRSDGSSVRYLGPASRAPLFKYELDASEPGGFFSDSSYGAGFASSPDGRTVAFRDLGTAPDGTESEQIFTLRLADGARRQVTRLPPVTQRGIGIHAISFVDADTISFLVREPDRFTAYTIRLDGDGDAVVLSPPAALPGATFAPTYVITAGDRQIFALYLPDVMAENPGGPDSDRAGELFAIAGEETLQLTNFKRRETLPAFQAADGRVVFVASANPPEINKNPYNNCQYFSIDALGGDLQQLTSFDPGQPASQPACFPGPSPGCNVTQIAYESTTDVALFESSCDPLGTNPAGEQAFAMRADGSGLRQLTFARGVVTEADGTVSVELAGQFVHPRSILPGA
jgi:hypothetical protein